MSEHNESPRFELNKKDGKQIWKVFVYSMISGACAFFLVLIPLLDIPPQYAAYAALAIPMVNTGIVALKKFADDHGKL